MFDVEPPVDNFVGRNDDLKAVKWMHSQNQHVVVVGPRGIGKTQFARRYADAFYRGNIIWFDCSSAKAMFKNLLKLAVEIKQPVHNISSADLIHNVFHFFKNRKTMFIFDNAKPDNYVLTDLRFLIENNDNNKVIVTAREENWDRSKFRVLSLKILTKDQSIKFIKNELADFEFIAENNVYETLAEISGFMPMALKTIADYTAQKYEMGTFLTLDEFVNHIEDSDLLLVLNNQFYDTSFKKM